MASLREVIAESGHPSIFCTTSALIYGTIDRVCVHAFSESLIESPDHMHDLLAENGDSTKVKRYSDLTSFFHAGVSLLDGVGQVRVYTPRRGR